MNHNRVHPESNVCLCSDTQDNNDAIFPFQFVYETLPAKLRYPKELQHYRCHIVTEGAGFIKADSTQHLLKAGDLIFIRPGCSFSLTDIRGLKYLYISFTGMNLNRAFADYGIVNPVEVFSGFNKLIDQWMEALSVCNENNLTTLTKGLIYYTLALLPTEGRSEHHQSNDVIAQIRSFIDCSYGNSALSLDYICRMYNYHPNYISRRFHEATGSSFSEYLEFCRISHARSLLLETELPVHDIAMGVGYHNAMYFSKVFRKNTGASPSEYRKRNRLGKLPQNGSAGT